MLEASNKFIEFDKSMNFEFITGPNSKEFIEKVEHLNPKKTFFIVFSKSFETIETLEMLRMAQQWSGDNKKFLALTSNATKPKEYGIQYIHTFDKEIGGRYSIWSPMTQFHLFGKKRIEFLKGGHTADVDIIKNKKYLNFIKKLSFIDIYLNSHGKNARAIFSYIWNLRSLPNYLQQLEMESLGKHANPESRFKNTGQIIFGGYGPTAQHSYFQLLHQGTQNICADIIVSTEDKESLVYAQAITQSNLLANGESEIELSNESKINGNVPVNLFLLRKLDAFNLGYLIATWEYRILITALILKINAFDQFGVSAGKIYTNKYLSKKD